MQWLSSWRGVNMAVDDFAGVQVTIRRTPILETAEFYALKPTLIEKICRNKLEFFSSNHGTKVTSILRHMRHWCIENCQDFVYIVDDRTFYFESEEEAGMFILRWVQEG